MGQIKRREIWRAMELAGWLDTQTGEIFLMSASEEADGVYRYPLKPDIINNPERYIRLPHICSVRASVELVEHLAIGNDTLKEYNVDINKFITKDQLFYPEGREQVSYTKEELDFIENVYYIVEGNEELERASDEFWEQYDIMLVNQWCKEHGYDLVGDWDFF